jgi:hypothetical protein
MNQKHRLADTPGTKEHIMNTRRSFVNLARVRGALHCVKRERVQLSMGGKFLPLKDEGAKWNEGAYGLKEE